MKYAALLVLVGLAVPSWAADIQVSAKVKTDTTRKSESQQLAQGSTLREEKRQHLEITVTSRDRNLESTVRVQWAVAGEGMAGRLHELTRGEQSVDLPFGKPVRVESESFEIASREWYNAHGRGEVKEDVYGYGVRVVDSHDTILAEKYVPAGMEDLIEEKLAEEKTREQRRDQVRERVRPGSDPGERMFRRQLRENTR